MGDVETIEVDGQQVAIIVRAGVAAPGVQFFTPGTYSQQLASMSHPAGKIIDPHVHNHVRREVFHTNEVLVLRRGRLRVDFYSEARKYRTSRVLEAGDVILLVAGGHGFEVLEDVEMIEVKQGPYAGDADKTQVPLRPHGHPGRRGPVTPIPVNEPLLDGNERRYLQQCIDEGWVSSDGPFVAEFERRFAARVARQHGVAVANGSAALEAAVAALGLQPGDEVIVPTFTIISCVAPLVRAGLVPVLVDSDPATWNMDPAAVARRIGPRTRAIMVVHIYGLPVDLDPILALAKEHGLRVIEDAAEAHGQDYRGRPCGSFGDLSVFSFYPNKHVTTGEGGMILTDDDGLAERCRELRNLCFVPGKRRFVHEELGWNFRMSNLQAAVGVAQLERLDEFVARKRRMGRRYSELLAGVPGLELPVARTPYAENVYWVFGVVLTDEVPFDAEEAMRRLAARGIGTRPFFYPMHQQPVFRRMGLFAADRHPVAERLAARGFYLPSGLALREEQTSAASPRRSGPCSRTAPDGAPRPLPRDQPPCRRDVPVRLSVIRGLAPLLDAGWTVTAFAHDDSWRADLPAGFRLVVRPTGSPVPGRRLPADVSSPRRLPLAYSGGWTRWSGPSMRPAATWSSVRARTRSDTSCGAAPWSRSTT